MKTRALTHALFLFAAITIGSSAPQSANATSMVPLTHSQLVDAADYIVRGKVVEVWAEQAADGTVWTRAQVDISHTFKGKNRSHLVVDQMGGTWGESETLVHGGARFSAGERVILFAEELGNGRIVSVGMQQGKYTLRMDPYSQETIVQRFSPGPKAAYDHRFIPLPPKADRLVVTDFEDEITDRLQSGWDGKPIPGSSIQRLQRINANTAEVK